MRRISYFVLLSLIGVAPAISVQAADNRCAYLETQGDCLCAIPQEWVKDGVVGTVTGDAMATNPAGFSGVPQDGKIALGDPSTVIAGSGGASLAMGQCYKALPQNVTVYVDKKGENCECAHLVQRGAVIPWMPVAAIAGTAGVIVIVGLPGSGPASE